MSSLLLLAALALLPQDQAPLERIAFGSCIRQDRPQPIWNALVQHAPETFLFLGDNIYGDSDDPEVLAAKYAMLQAQPGYESLVASARIFGTWDDHDYGRNDAGEEYPAREASQALFLDFLGVPQDSPRRARAGVYHAEVVGPPGQRVQFLLLDTRYHRSALERVDSRLRGRGPYAPSTDPDRTMLGEEQWSWLEDQLRVPAEVRVLATSIQLVSDGHGWEGWGTMPLERARLLDLIGRTRAGGVIAISGDRHAAEISRLEPLRDGRGAGYPILDVTASSMNAGRGWSPERNPYRVGDLYGGTNFGSLAIDWAGEETSLEVAIHDENGEVALRHSVRLAELQPPPEPEVLVPQRLERVAFGSCIQQSRSTPLWEPLRALSPDLFLLLGDNVYGDTEDMQVLRAAYGDLASQQGFALLREEVPLLATWDDHDFGSNDAGKEWPWRHASEEIFLDFFEVPADSPRRAREGVHGAWCYGPPDERVQVILLDLRMHRDPWGRRDDRPRAGDGRPGGYAPNTTPGATILGEEQWAWLEERLRVPARLRLIGSSLQCLSQGHSWECWDMMPAERERLFQTLRRTRANGVVLLSGDTHWAELSRVDPEDSGVPYALWELTSSGLNQAWAYTNIDNVHRVAVPLWEPNFGMVSVDWETGKVVLEARSERNVLSQELHLDELRPARD